MVRKVSIVILILCLSLIVAGCQKKTVVKEGPSTREAELQAAEREKAAKLEAERKEREEKEAARMREEEAKRMREEEAARIREEEAKRMREEAAKRMREEEAKRMREEEAKRMREEEAKKAAASKEFEKSLVAKRTPGIEGEIFESRLLKDIYFDFDRYDIRSGEAEVLRENASLLMKYPSIKIQIEGHCDERGTVEYNLALGQRRANSTMKYLIFLGVPEDRISTISYGEERPFDPNHHEEAWAKNRRAHFVILSK